MRVSIIIPVYNSHRVVERQIKHFKKMNLPDDIEIIFMDDGSDPPLKGNMKNFNIYPTGDTRPWTQPCAKNLGVKISEGEYIFITDIDHILPKKVVLQAYEFQGDKMGFSRSFAILSHNGDIFNDPESLFKYGMGRKRYAKRGTKVYRHTNTFVMRKKVFEAIGGYRESLCDKGIQWHRDDSYLHRDYRRHCAKGSCQPEVMGGEVHVFPAVAEDPKKLFHRLGR
jgi:glycosyltransferase involved in cell wall biosynthesis